MISCRLANQWWRALLLWCLLLVSSTSTAQSALHEQVFGKRAAREQALAVSVEIDASALGEVGVRILQQQLLNLDRDTLLELLRPWFDDAGLSCVQALPERFAPLQAKACELTLSFDASALRLTIELPVERRRERQLQLRASRSSTASLQRIGSSAYLNMAVGQRQRSEQPSTLSGLFDGAFGRGSSTLEFEGSCVASRCRVDQTRLLHDQPQQLRRWQLGDLGSGGAGTLAVPALRGIRVGTDFELQPELGFTPQLQAPLELDRAATLEVWQDARLIRRERLGPGRYQLSDFPLGFGWNEAQLRITDDAGRVQTRTLSTYVDLSLLDEGLTRYSASLGQPRLGLPSPTQRPWLLAFDFARGLHAGTLSVAAFSVPQSEHHALELSWSQGHQQQLWGTQLSCSQRNHASSRSGCKASVALRRDASNAAQGWQQQAQLDWRSAQWLDLLDDQPAGTEVAASWRGYRALSERWQLGVAAQWQRQSNRRSSGAGAQLSARLARGWSMRIGLDHSRERSAAGVRSDLGLNINLVWLFDEARQSFSLNFDGMDEVSSLGWQHANGAQRGGWSNSVMLTDSPLARLYSAASRWRAERFSGELNYARSDTDARSTSELGLQARTALVYAEGAFGLTERVNGGFAILQPAASDVGAVYVNPYQDDYLASNRGPGPAVVNNLRPYQSRELVVSMPELPAGRDPGELLPNVQAPFKGGVRVALGGQRSVGLRALVVDGKGEPLAMLPGSLRRLDCTPPCPAALPVFVGRNGRLTAMGLTPGRWQLELPSLGRRHVFELSAETQGIFDLGVLQP